MRDRTCHAKPSEPHTPLMSVRELIDRGDCAGQGAGLFFRRAGKPRADNFDGRHICQTCPVVEGCLEQQLAFESGIDKSYRVGIWGAKTPAERCEIDRERRALTKCGEVAA